MSAAIHQHHNLKSIINVVFDSPIQTVVKLQWQGVPVDGLQLGDSETQQNSEQWKLRNYLAAACLYSSYTGAEIQVTQHTSTVCKSYFLENPSDW